MASVGVDVYVKLSTGASKQYDVIPSTTIQSLVSLVAADEGVASHLVRLKHQGKVLVNTKTVGQYGVRPETILKSEILVPKDLALVVNLPGDRTEEITISNLESANSLHDLIAENIGATKNSLKVEYKGRTLNASPNSLLENGVENCAELHVTIRDIIEEEKRNKSSNEDNADNLNPMDEREKEGIMSSFQSNGRNVDVVFSFDTTGSMYSCLSEVRTKLRESCRRLIQDIPGIRIGLIAHGDYCDQNERYVVRSIDLTNDVDRLVQFANDVPSTGGGDAPECYEWVLRKAQFLDWSEDSAKALVMIGDLHPHPPSYTDQNIEWRNEVDLLKGMGVKVYGVQALHNNTATSFYQEIAERTEARHLRLTDFDVITDMFLAVCYREGDEQLLEEFESELQQAGRMSEQTKAIFEELKETDEEKKKKKEITQKSSHPRYVNKEWWDHSLKKENENPCYLYDEQNDTWNPRREESSSSYETVPPTVHHITSYISKEELKRRSSRRKRKGVNGKGCVVM